MPTILIVDDVPESIKFVMAALNSFNYEILVATSGQIALEVATSQLPDLILLDIVMPNINGYEVCQQLKANVTTHQIPIIFMTARDEVEDEIKGLELGAVDYITKPIHPPIVQARVKTHLNLKQALEELEQKNALLEQTAMLRDDVEHILRHDLKTPLNGIISYSMMLLEMLELEPTTKNMLVKIEALSYEMLNMINRSLDLYKMEIGSYQYVPQSMDVLAIIRKIVSETENIVAVQQIKVQILQRQKNVTLNDTFVVQTEYALFYSMLANLFKNALEASPKGATITLSLDKDLNMAIIRIHNQKAVPLSIRDTFFEKHSTFGKTGGTGLGTYSAQLMAETQGGYIELETSEQTGTTVIVRLPL